MVDVTYMLAFSGERGAQRRVYECYEDCLDDAFGGLENPKAGYEQLFFISHIKKANAHHFAVIKKSINLPFEGAWYKEITYIYTKYRRIK